MSDLSEGTNPLQATLTEEQNTLLKLLLDTFNEYRTWPLWQYVEQKCDDAGFDGAAVLASLPIVGSKQGFYGLNYGLTWTQGTLGASHQPGDPVGLTVVGLYRAGAVEYVQLFLRVLAMACEKLRSFIPNPQEAITLELTSTEVYSELSDDQKALLAPHALYAVIQHEPAGWSGGGGTTAEGEWRWGITRPIRRYQDVRTIDDYIGEITALTNEHAQQVADTVPFAVPGAFDSRIEAANGYAAEAAQLAQQLSADHAADLWGNGIVRVFISHLASERAFVGEVSDELNGLGISSFVAHDNIDVSREWQDEIERALRTADVLVGLVHPNFSESFWTQQEIGWALGREIPVLLMGLGEVPRGFPARYQAPMLRELTAWKVASTIAVWLTRMEQWGLAVVDALVHDLETASSFASAKDAAERLKGVGKLTPAVLDAIEHAYLSNDQLYPNHVGAKVVEAILEVHGRTLPRDKEFLGQKRG